MVDAFVLPGGAGLGTAPMGGPGWQADWGPSDPEESVAAVRAAASAGVGWMADGFDLDALTAGDLRRRLRWADPAVLDLAGLRRDLSALASGAGLSMSALAAGWVLARGAQPIIGARTPAEARQVAAVRPIPPGLAAAAEAATGAARTTAR
jgi:aryl-alcohol dehydrogenase-like predicted oxidoreductase